MAHIEPSARINANVLDRFLRIKTEPIYRRSTLMRELQSRNRISFNNHGKKLSWRPRYRRRTITAGLGNPVAISFPQTPIRREVTLPWRHYQMGESVAKYEALVSQNPETALFPIIEEVTGTCAEDFLEDFRQKLWLDGDAAPGRDIHGFQSFTSTSGLVSGSPCGNPNDTYAGVSTALGVSGSWTGNWPVGTGDTEYCWWSHMKVDVNHTSFTPGTTGLSATWQKAIRFVTTFGAALQRADYDLLILCSDWYRIIRDSLSSSERFIAQPAPRNTDVGFKYLTFEGLNIDHEYGCPDNLGAFFTFDKCELRCLTGQLIEMMEDSDITAGGQLLYAFQAYCNMMWESPMFFPSLAEISALGT